LILLFLIVHSGTILGEEHATSWAAMEPYGTDAAGQENLFALMADVFANPLIVVLYVLGCFRSVLAPAPRLQKRVPILGS
jgi:hypothetical protein